MCSAFFASSGTLGEPEIEHDGTVTSRRLAVVRVCSITSAGSVEAGLGTLDVRAHLPCNSALVTTRTKIERAVPVLDDAIQFANLRLTCLNAIKLSL
jgi:hypothetical protein